METSQILLIMFLMGLTVPLFSYHIFLLIKTGQKINYYFAIFAIINAIYIMIFSDIPTLSLSGTKTLYFLPIFELFLILGLLYSLYEMVKQNTVLKMEYIIKIYYSIIGLALFVFIVYLIARWNHLDHLNDFSMAALLCNILLLSFLIVLLFHLFHIPESPLIYKITLLIMVTFLTASILGYFLPYFFAFKNFFFHIPIVLYLLSFYLFHKYVKYEIPQENNTPSQGETTNKIIHFTPKEEAKPETDLKAEETISKNKTELPPKKEKEEERINIHFSEELRNKTQIYNHIKNVTKIKKNLIENIYLHAKKTDFDDFIHALFTFIYNTPAVQEELNLKMNMDGDFVFLSCGEFQMTAGDRSLNMEKVRLTQLKKTTEQLGGFLTLTKNGETNGIIFRIKFPIVNSNETSEKINTPSALNDNPYLLLAVNNQDTYRYLSKLLTENYNLIQEYETEGVIQALTTKKYPFLAVVIAMHQDDENQELYYSIERLPQFSDIPLLIIANQHQNYLDLKNYRLYSTVELIRPIDQKELIEKIHGIREKIRNNKNRNIHKIGDKIENSESDENSQKKSSFLQQFEEKASFYLLTNKEKMIVLFLLKGMEYKQIVQKTNLSMENILKSIDKIYDKTGVNSKIELIDLFVR